MARHIHSSFLCGALNFTLPERVWQAQPDCWVAGTSPGTGLFSAASAGRDCLSSVKPFGDAIGMCQKFRLSKACIAKIFWGTERTAGRERSETVS